MNAIEEKTISLEEHCQFIGMDPVPKSGLDQLTAIFEHEIEEHHRVAPSRFKAYAPAIALGAVLGVAAFKFLEPWLMPLA